MILPYFIRINSGMKFSWGSHYSSKKNATQYMHKVILSVLQNKKKLQYMTKTE